MESLEELRHWVAEEARTRYTHQKLGIVCAVLEVYEERAQLSLISGPQKRNVIVHV